MDECINKKCINYDEDGDNNCLTEMDIKICPNHLTAKKDAVADVCCNDGLSGTVPLLRGKPEITNDMKAQCHGEFRFDIEETCTACYYNEPQKDCEVCAGEVHYIRSAEVPWDTMKDIYKSMAAVAMTAT